MPDNPETPRAGGFPTTQWSAVAGVRSADAAERERSCGQLVAAYWKPVYKYIRLRWRRSPDDAQDLTQEFFLRAIDKDWFAPYDPSRARFRTFLRTCLDGFLANEEKAARRQKRGGDVTILPLAFDRAEGELTEADLPAAESPERYFDAEWARSLFEVALEALRTGCDTPERRVHLEIFERYDLGDPAGDRPTYEELGRPHGLTAAQVTHHLAWARRELRRLLLDSLRSLTATEDEFRREARELLGIDPR